jgi:glutamate/tyrosine decarboxylase-like PLP-dependent enzyme
VSTGAVDPLPDIAGICREYNLWFHVDGAYGAFAAALPDASHDLKGLSQADSVAMDPHKWLYSPLEAGCVLVRDPTTLIDAFSYHPEYYHFEESAGDPIINYYEYGLQNSRGFRALKVWLGLRQAGRQGYIRMISDDIELAWVLHQRAVEHPELQAFTHNLSITTFRYIPTHLDETREGADVYLDALNTELMERLQQGGEAYVSNAIVDGKFVLRACVVNFRTKLADIEALPEIVARIGRQVDSEMRPAEL